MHTHAHTHTSPPPGPHTAHCPAVPPISSRGTPRVREVVRSVRKEMLTMEQNVPWHGVAPAWRTSRPAWLKALAKLEAAAVTQQQQQVGGGAGAGAGPGGVGWGGVQGA